MELCHVNEPEEDDEEDEENVLADMMPEAKDTRPIKKHAHIDGYFKAQENSDVNDKANNNTSDDTPDMEEDFIVREDSHHKDDMAAKEANSSHQTDDIDVDTSRVENDNPILHDMSGRPPVKADETGIPPQDDAHQPSDDVMDGM